MPTDKPDTTKARDHTRCCFSTSIAGHITAGRGKLEWTGEWEFPCLECAERAERKWGAATNG